MISKQLTEVYQLLFDAFGPQHWWPGETQFEIITGAILTQNTSWGNVEKAIANIKSAECLAPEKLHDLDLSQLAELIRPAGYYNIKAKRLKSFMDWLFDNYQGFVVDAYTARIAVRHGLIEPGADYEQLQELFQSNLPQDTPLFNEYHALLVRLGKEFCRPKAKCTLCPIEKLPHSLETEY